MMLTMIRISRSVQYKNGTKAEVESYTYIANKPENCKCTLDRAAYDLATQSGQTVSIGCVTARPLREVQAKLGYKAKS
jgi:hypothetical protein